MPPLSEARTSADSLCAWRSAIVDPNAHVVLVALDSRSALTNAPHELLATVGTRRLPNRMTSDLTSVLRTASSNASLLER